METVWIVLGWILAGLGIIGSFVPVLPGPLLAFCAMISMWAGGALEMNAASWMMWGGTMLIVSVLDYLLPGWMAKRFGGSKAGVIGATIGALVGLFFGPLGIIFGPFVGAVVGEMLHDTRRDLAHALQVGVGSFLAFVVGTGIKLVYAVLVFVKLL